MTRGRARGPRASRPSRATSPSPTAAPVRPAAIRSSPVICEPAVADVVEPALRRRVARRGEQLDGLDALATQKAPQLGVGDVQGTVERLKAARRGHVTSRSLAMNPRWSRRAASSSRGTFVQQAASASGPEPARSASHVTSKPSPSSAGPGRSARAAAARRRLAQQQPQLVAQAVAGDGRAQRGVDQRRRARVRRELEPRGVADEPQHPRRVVDERALVEDAQHAVLEVLARPGPVRPRAVEHGHGHRVDREVAARQVVLDARAQLDLRQRARPRVALAARARQVEGELAGADVAVPKRSWTVSAPPTRSAARCATGIASPSTTRSSSRGTLPSRASRIAPPTTYTPGSPAIAESTSSAPGASRRGSMPHIFR